MTPRPLLLASTSPARAALMDGLGLPFRAVAPGVDESLEGPCTAEEAVAMLAEKKARAVFARNPDAWVLGADQLARFEGQLLGKPPHLADAREMLRRLSGRQHSLFTGVCLLGPGFAESQVDVVTLSMYPLSEAEREAYLATGEWQGCAGGYRVEGRGQALFADIQGDRTSVQGLPMQRVVSLLRRAGFQFFE
jgi:septum formation protein